MNKNIVQPIWPFHTCVWYLNTLAGWLCWDPYRSITPLGSILPKHIDEIVCRLSNSVDAMVSPIPLDLAAKLRTYDIRPDVDVHRNLQFITIFKPLILAHLWKQYNFLSLRWSRSIACQCCFNYIFFRDRTPASVTGWETLKFWNLVRLIPEVCRCITFMLFFVPVRFANFLLWQLEIWLCCMHISSDAYISTLGNYWGNWANYLYLPGTS